MKKKFVSVLLALTMSTTLSAGLTSTVFAEEAVSTASECSYDGGSGTQEDPYQISSTDSFLTFAANVNDGSNAGYADTYFLLTNDLDLTGIDWEPIGNMNDMENPPPLGGDSLRLWIKLCKIINLIIRKGRKARKYSICAALGNFVPIVSYRNLSYLDEKMVY